MIQLLYCIIFYVFLHDYCKSTKILPLTISTSLGLYLEMDNWKIKIMMMMNKLALSEVCTTCNEDTKTE
jgi:hypothetical protein